MRKLLVVVAVAVAVLALGAGPALAETVIKAGLDLEGTGKWGSFEQDIEQSYTVGLEYYLGVHQFVDIGVGGEYQLPRSAKGSSGNFQFIPAYGCVRVAPLSLPVVRPYAAGRAGYNFLLGNDEFKGPGGELKGGFHWGIGAGASVLQVLIVEGMYTVYNGTLSWSGSDIDFTYSKFSLYAGLQF